MLTPLTHRHKVSVTGAVASWVHDFESSEPEHSGFVSVTVTDGDYVNAHVLPSEVWSECLAAMQDWLSITFPTIPAHDNNHRGGDA